MNRNIRVLRNRRVPVVLYDTALNSAAYGNTAVMGDLFNDIMGAVVPKWNDRPDWMKKIVVKPDPAKIAETAIKAVPPSRVGKVIGQAEKYGVNLFYNTPAGQIPVTSQTAESMYSNFPAFARAHAGLSSIPTWVYLVGGLGLVLVVFMTKKH